MAFTTHGIELPDPGSDTNTWGDILNDDTFPMLVKLVLGNEAMSLTANKTLSSTNGVDNEARNFWLVFSDGGLSGVPTVTIPGVEKVYIVSNTGTTYAITMTAGGVTASIPAGRTCLVRCDGTDVIAVDFVGLASNEPLDSVFRIKGSSDATKKVAFEVDGLTTATTRTVTVPDATGTLLLNTGGQTTETVSASPAANQNDYAPATISPYSAIETTLLLTPTVSMKITGISSTSFQTGKIIRIRNGTDPAAAGARLIILERASALSLAANRFNFAKSTIPVMLMPGDEVMVRWNGTNFDFASATRSTSFLGFFDYTSPPGGSFLYNASGTASGVLGVEPAAELLSGVVTSVNECLTGTDSDGRSAIILTDNASLNAGSGAMLLLSTVNIPVLATNGAQEFDVNVGFMDSYEASTNIVDGIGWRYKLDDSVNWQVFAKANSVETRNSAGFAATAGRFVRLGVFVNGDGSRADYFYSNDEAITWEFTAAISANVPTGASRTFGAIAGIAKTLGSTSRTLQLAGLGLRRQTLI